MYSKKSIGGSIYLYLNQLGLKISKRTIHSAIEQHPLKNTARCVSDIFDDLHIPHVVCELNIEQIKEVESPFMVMLDIEDEPLRLVEKIDSENITLRSVSGCVCYSWSHFSQIWRGIAIAAESGDATFKETTISYYINQFISFVEERLLLIVTLLVAILLFINITITSTLHALLIASLLFGAGTSLIVIRKSILDATLFDGLCRTTKGDGCNDVLNSSGAKILNWLSLGEVSFAYFFASLLLSISAQGDTTPLWILLSAMASIFVVYSLTWQTTQRKWCSLCMCINIAIIAEFTASFLLFTTSTITATVVIRFIVFSLLFAVITLLALQLRRYIESTKRVLHLENKRDQVLTEANLFETLIGKTPLVESSQPYSPLSNDVVSENRITVVMNPICPKCARVHNMLKSLSDYHIDIILITYSTDARAVNIAIKFIAIYRLFGWEVAHNAISKWYEHKIIDDSITSTESDLAVYNRHNEYCQRVNLQGTPTIYVNQHLLPQIYDITDLRVIL